MDNDFDFDLNDLDFGEDLQDSFSGDSGSGNNGVKQSQDNGSFDDFGELETDDDGGMSDQPDQDGAIADFGFGNSSGNNVNAATSDKKGFNNTLILFAVIGVILIVLSMFLMRGRNSGRKGGNYNSVGADKTAVMSDSQSMGSDTYNYSNIQLQPQIQTQNDWIAVDSVGDITWEKSTINSVFQITEINHYVKVVDSNNNMEIKSVLTGTLAGLAGTYLLEVPYEKGCLLSIADEFSVRVQIGDYKGKRVIGEIAYK